MSKELTPNDLARYELDPSALDNLEIADDEVKIYLATLPKITRFNTREEDEILINRVRSGDKPHEARAELFFSVARMAVFRALKLENARVSTMDLIQAANLAIWEHAINKYDPSLGKFSTYAMFWIMAAQHRELIKFGRTDKIAESTIFEVGKVVKAEFRFMAENGHEPDTEKLAEITGFKPAKVRHLIDISKRKNIYTSDKIDDKETELGEVISDPNALHRNDVEDRIDSDRAKEMILAEIDNLDYPRYAKLLRLRLGIKNGQWTGEKLSLEEIGNKTGVTRERARQLQRRAIFYIKDPRIRRALKEVLEYPII